MANGLQVQANVLDPLKTFKFLLRCDGNFLVGVMKVSMLKRTTKVITHRSGGENSVDHRTPGQSAYDGVTLERGITFDLAFENWANKVHPPAGDTSMDLANFRKECALEVLNEKGQVAKRYFLHGCWVSEYQALPALDSSANAIAIESIKLEMEYWERDTSVTQPT
jgi:phage tail-like protein